MKAKLFWLFCGLLFLVGWEQSCEAAIRRVTVVHRRTATGSKTVVRKSTALGAVGRVVLFPPKVVIRAFAR